MERLVKLERDGDKGGTRDKTLRSSQELHTSNKGTTKIHCQSVRLIQGCSVQASGSSEDVVVAVDQKKNVRMYLSPPTPLVINSDDFFKPSSLKSEPMPRKTVVGACLATAVAACMHGHVIVAARQSTFDSKA